MFEIALINGVVMAQMLHLGGRKFDEDRKADTHGRQKIGEQKASFINKS